MKKDKENSIKDKTFCTADYDLQKVLTTPRAEIGPLYYLSKISVYNFTIFETGNHKGYCNVWNETDGKRGSHQIATLVLNFLKEKQEAGVKNLVFYSDNCGGQNRNQNIFSMYYKASKDLQINIIHR